MDLAVGARNVFIAMEHTTREGAPRLVERCSMPVTARGVVKLVITELGLFRVTADGLKIEEIAPGIDLAAVQAATGCPLIVPAELPVVQA